MKESILHKLKNLYEDNKWMNTYSLMKELSSISEDPLNTLNKLISEKYIERIMDEKIDICSFRTKRFMRYLKLTSY